MFGGLGNDSIIGGTGRDTIQGNEDNDTIRGDLLARAASTPSPVAPATTCSPTGSVGEDGDNVAGGGPVEFLTDVDWSVDRIQLLGPVINFAANMGAGTGVDLATSATNAIAAAVALNGGDTHVAAQFTFAGRTYVVMNIGGGADFNDGQDVAVDVTGVTGTISAANFIT